MNSTELMEYYAEYKQAATTIPFPEWVLTTKLKLHKDSDEYDAALYSLMNPLREPLTKTDEVLDSKCPTYYPNFEHITIEQIRAACDYLPEVDFSWVTPEKLYQSFYEQGARTDFTEAQRAEQLKFCEELVAYTKKARVSAPNDLQACANLVPEIDAAIKQHVEGIKEKGLRAQSGRITTSNIFSKSDGPDVANCAPNYLEQMQTATPLPRVREGEHKCDKCGIVVATVSYLCDEVLINCTNGCTLKSLVSNEVVCSCGNIIKLE